MANWEVGRSQRMCAVTGKVFEDGDEYFSALREQGESFSRQDFSPAAWQEQDKSLYFSFWRTRLQKGERKKNKLVIDVEAFYTFFRSLEGEEATGRQIFRYLVALMLVRKRVLRLEEVEKHPEGETLILFDTRTKEECRVPAPAATEEQLATAQEELNQIFECGGGDPVGEDPL